MSKIKRKYTENYLYGINKETLTTFKLIYSTAFSQQYLDPNGGDRDVSFSGTTFKSGDTFEIKNIGTNYNLNVISISPTKSIRPGELIKFFYDGNNWNIASNEYLFLELDENGDLMPI